MVFVVGVQTTNTTNEATLPTFTCSASSYHENIIHEVTKYCSTTNVLLPTGYNIIMATIIILKVQYMMPSVHDALST